MNTETQGLKQELVVYQLVAAIYQKEQGPLLGIFATESDAQAIIDQTPEPERNWLRIEPVIIGRLTEYRRWLAAMDANAASAPALRKPDDEAAARITDDVVDEEFGHESNSDESGSRDRR